jgi:catechol 2,3-dioxygenase-like lactoylglutathione lyase family enzyme
MVSTIGTEVSAIRPAKRAAVSMRLGPIVPVLRIFDEEKAKAFYVGYLGCAVDWEHRFEPEMPLYMQVSRAGIVLHLSEHHGDGSPGAKVRVKSTDVKALHGELTAKEYKYLRPGLQEMPWGELSLELIDPFGNHLIIYESIPNSA